MIFIVMILVCSHHGADCDYHPFHHMEYPDRALCEAAIDNLRLGYANAPEFACMPDWRNP